MTPSAQPHILDLPDEILDAVLGAVRDWQPGYGDHVWLWDSFNRLNIRAIQNARLTCHRFCSISSKYLISSVYVEGTPESLENLDQISNHHTIGPGVTAMQIYLPVYDSSFADSFADFADCQAEYLSEQIESLQGPCRGTMPNSEQANARHCEKLQRIIHAWSALRSRAMLEATEQDLHYQRLLELGFQKFSDRFLKRQEIIESGILVQRIKLALSKMQAVRHLKIRDEDEKRLELFQRATQVSSDAAVVDDEQLLRGMSRWQPMQSADVVAHYEEFPPGAPILIPALLAELDTVISRRLVSLDIGISTGRSLEELSATDTVYSKIQASMQNLKSFRFNHRGPIFPRILDELETLRDFLGSFIVVESLESLAIETNLWKEADSLTAYDPVVLPSTSLIKARTAWPNLSSVLLNTLLIEHSDLTHLLSCVNSTRGCVVLQNIHLLDGSWATILDLLRERHSWAYLASPSGAECEAMSVEEYKRIFGPYNPIDNRTQDEEVTSEPKEAQAYIRGWQDKNPLNIPPELIQSS